MGHIFDSLWVEKYRPQTLTDIVLSEDNRRILEDVIKKNEIPNFLFIGNPGIGKTSLAKIIVKDALSCQYLYINASDENGIDTIRSKVTNFSKTRSLDGHTKIIILDEVDGLTMDAQRALRNTMEEYSAFTRFILTANYNHRVIPAVQSRCQSFNLVPPLNDYFTRVDDILKDESIVVSGEQDKQVREVVRSLYPDLRKAINFIQKCCTSGKFILTKFDGGEFAKQIITLVQKGAALKLRKVIIENEEKFNSDYQNLLRGIFNEVESLDRLDDSTKKEWLLIIAEHLYRSAFVADQEINFFSCLIGLSK
jgi:replication factor C small subunit